MRRVCSRASAAKARRARQVRALSRASIRHDLRGLAIAAAAIARGHCNELRRRLIYKVDETRARESESELSK